VAENEGIDEQTLRTLITGPIEAAYEQKTVEIGPEVMRQFEKVVMLSRLDAQWKEHLAALDYLRQGIHLRGYAQKNPKQEYKREAFEMFSDMLEQVKREVTSILMRAQVRSEDDVEAMEERRAEEQRRRMQFQHAEAPGMAAAPGQQAVRPADGVDADPAVPFVRDERKIGRNEPCPCGSGKKYKHCHGRLS